MRIKIFFLFFFITFTAKSQISFENPFPLESGFYSYYGVAISDMNNDGRQDIVRVSYKGQVSIAIQVADGVFSPVYIDSIPYNPFTPGAWSICVAEINNDNTNDFFIGIRGEQVLFKSTGIMQYQKIVFSDTFFTQGSNFVDIDSDGDLDLFACDDDSLNITYENDGNGNFTKNLGMIPSMSPYSGNYGSVWTDYDNDGDLDLYISKCRHGVVDSTNARRINLLYRNDAGVYNEVGTLANLDDSSQSWAADFGDIDNDGDMDVIIVNHMAFNRLYENNGDGTFTNISPQSGITQHTSADYWQCLFRDFDNDGYLDIITATDNSVEHFYHNNGDKTFTLITNPYPNPSFFSCAIGDLNNDGFMDVFAVKNPIPISSDDDVVINSGNINNYLGILLEGNQSGKNAIGSKIKLYGSWGVQTREIRSGESYGIHNSFEKIFGLGQNSMFDSLVVEWYGGGRCVFDSLEINNKIKIKEDCSVEHLIGLEHEINKTTFEVFPTLLQSGDKLKIFSKHKGILKVLDVYGKEIYLSKLNSNQLKEIPTHNFGVGLFLVQLENHTKTITQKVIIY